MTDYSDCKNLMQTAAMIDEFLAAQRVAPLDTDAQDQMVTQASSSFCPTMTTHTNPDHPFWQPNALPSEPLVHRKRHQRLHSISYKTPDRPMGTHHGRSASMHLLSPPLDLVLSPQFYPNPAQLSPGGLRHRLSLDDLFQDSPVSTQSPTELQTLPTRPAGMHPGRRQSHLSVRSTGHLDYLSQDAARLNLLSPVSSPLSDHERQSSGSAISPYTPNSAGKLLFIYN